jgi:hypothetical protein
MPLLLKVGDMRQYGTLAVAYVESRWVYLIVILINESQDEDAVSESSHARRVLLASF